MKYKKGFKYQLHENIWFQTEIYPKDIIETQFITLLENGRLAIFSGYAWDGASGPTKDDKTNMSPSLVHDALCQLMRLGLISKNYYHYANLLFSQMLRERGMNYFRAWYYYHGVETKMAEMIATGKPKAVIEVK